MRPGHARGMMKILMLRQVGQRGDTLIEVTFALAILGAVLVGASLIATVAFRSGETGTERTQIAEVAQEQMEALRSFRDGHTWNQFQCGSTADCSGPAGPYSGINQVMNANPGTCSLNGDVHCFHMELTDTSPTTHEWVPVAGPVDFAGDNSVPPTSEMEISTPTNLAAVNARGCGYDFTLSYQFDSLGSGAVQHNEITTRLVNLKYNPGSPAAADCP